MLGRLGGGVNMRGSGSIHINSRKTSSNAENHQHDKDDNDDGDKCNKPEI